MTTSELVGLFAEEEIIAEIKKARRPIDREELEDRVMTKLMRRGIPTFSHDVVRQEVLKLVNTGKICRKDDPAYDSTGGFSLALPRAKRA